jgi:hypothetical protein
VDDPFLDKLNELGFVDVESSKLVRDRKELNKAVSIKANGESRRTLRGPDGTNVRPFIPKVLDHEIVVEVFAVVGIVVTFQTKTFADKETIPFLKWQSHDLDNESKIIACRSFGIPERSGKSHP